MSGVRQDCADLESHLGNLMGCQVSWWTTKTIESKGVLITLKIDELIRQQCPEGIEKVKLGGISKSQQPKKTNH